MVQTDIDANPGAWRAGIAAVTLDYTNYRGERRKRRVTPHGMYWGQTDWHPELQWLLIVFDEETREERHFAMRNIHQWIFDHE